MYKASIPKLIEQVAPKNNTAIIIAVHPGIFIPKKYFVKIILPITTEVEKAIIPTKKIALNNQSENGNSEISKNCLIILMMFKSVI